MPSRALIIELVSHLVWSFALPFMTVAGFIYAVFAYRTRAQLAEYSTCPGLALLPGVGTFRLCIRLWRVAADYREETDRRSALFSEILGLLVTGPIVAGVVGIVLWAMVVAISPDLAAGLATGIFGVCNTAALIYACFSPVRTPTEQFDYDRSGSRLANYFIPGRALFNLCKRLGYSSTYRS